MRARFPGSATKLRGQRLLAGPAGPVGALVLALCALSVTLLAACGDDAADAGEQAGIRDAGSSGQAAAAANGGKAGAAAGRGGGPALPGVLPMLQQPPAIPCGTALCASPIAGLGFIVACCADEGTSTCGTAIPSGACMKPPVGDPRCPGLNFRGIISVPSCCTDQGACGLDGAMWGTSGCRDLESAAQEIEQMRAFGVSIPAPRLCDPWASAHPDAGVDDAGT